jgi:Ni,Fe-hydrogenase III component G
MFSAIMGRKKEDISEEDKDHAELVAKISKMNLTEMRSYINNKMKDFPVSEDGLIVVMQQLTKEDKKTKKYYIKSDDMDSKKKKAFDLVLAISQNKKISLIAIELIQKFAEVYKDIIYEYDREYKDIYGSRFLDAIKLGLANLREKAALKNKMHILGEYGE